MNTERTCLVGRDDDGAGWIIAIVIALVVVMIVCAIVVYGGAFIGGYHSLKNYIIAFKNNVVDSNRKPAAA